MEVETVEERNKRLKREYQRNMASRFNTRFKK